ncbi:unnamed protein product [Darwinula stevensoni]|uniref:Ferritin n=1 Tax=Darwinula stevensoni TaxID=69355 RepID=A0A7R8X7C8_9CRUS|nr:unnamed protein product [Darwinula stevensoni]CAG0888554.1 unnamed protein product [Darwinula stevensoni]
MPISQIRQSFHDESEAGINKQINLEMYASYVCLSMAAYFERDDVALKGFAKFFRKSSHEERECAEKLIHYQNMRGGRVVLNPIDKPSKDEWGSGLDAMIAALELQKTVNQAFLDLHAVAAKHADPQMTDFLEGKFLEDKVETIKKIGDHVTNLKRVGSGLGEFEFDKYLEKGSS